MVNQNLYSRPFVSLNKGAKDTEEPPLANNLFFILNKKQYLDLDSLLRSLRALREVYFDFCLLLSAFIRLNPVKGF